MVVTAAVKEVAGKVADSAEVKEVEMEVEMEAEMEVVEEAEMEAEKAGEEAVEMAVAKEAVLAEGVEEAMGEA